MYAENAIYSKITSRAQAKIFIGVYLTQAKEIMKMIYSFIWFNEKGGFIDKVVKKDDIMFLFIRNVESVFSGKVAQPAEARLMSMCREVDQHYHYVLESDAEVTNSADLHNLDVTGDEDHEEMGSPDHTE